MLIDLLQRMRKIPNNLHSVCVADVFRVGNNWCVIAEGLRQRSWLDVRAGIIKLLHFLVV